MRQRPIACLALLMFVILQILPAGIFYKSPQITEKCEGHIIGQVSRHTKNNDRLQLDLTSCQVRTGETAFETDHLLVYLSDTADIKAGTLLSLSGTIYPITQPTNPGQFDSRLYYEGRGISYTVFAEQAEVLSQEQRPVKEKLLQFRDRMASVYDALFESGDSGLLKAMVLGDKGTLDEEIKELYQKNGISHLLAISGLHISIVGLGLYHVLRRIIGSFAEAGIPTVLLILVYGWITGGSLSTIRAVAMCSLFVLAELIGRTYDTLTAIGAAALLMMCTNPLAAKQSAFLLSFGAVTSIALIRPIWILYQPRQGKLRATLSTGLSVLVFTFPLLLLYFSQYSLYSTLLNLLVVPLMSVLLVCGICCGVLGLYSFGLAGLPGQICEWILNFYQWLLERSIRLPGAVLHAGTPPVWKIILYYAVLTGILLILYREKRRKKYWRKKEVFRPKKWLAVVSVAGLLSAACMLCVQVHRGLSVVMLDVGQGDCVFFRDSEGRTYLSDGGSSDVSEVGTYRILPFLKHQGVGTLDYLMISHVDQDHVNGVQELIKESQKPGSLKINHAVLPALQRKDSSYLELESALKEAGISCLYMGAGDRLISEDFSLMCLWPLKVSVSDDRNEQSLVLLAKYGEFEMLLAGDIGAAAERSLAASGMLRTVEVLKTPHHGSNYSSSAIFLQKIQPKVSLISCSEKNRYGHPGKETLERLSDVGSEVLVTKDCGAIGVWTDGETVRVRTYLDGK